MNEQNNTGQTDRPTPTEPASFDDDTTRPPVADAATPVVKPSRKKRTWFIIGGALALVVLALVLTYIFWYQNPNKVVSDSMMNAMTAKSVSYTGDVVVSGDTKTTIALSGASAKSGSTVDAKLTFTVQGTEYTLDGNVLMAEQGDLYFKVKNIDELVGNYRVAVPEESRGLFDQMIEKINDKWVKVSAEDMRSFSADLANAQKCLTDAATKFQEDKAVRAEIATLYQAHPFVTIDEELGSKDGSLGYRLSSDRETAKDFALGLKDTSVYKTLHDCDDSFVIDEADLQKEVNDTDENSTVEVWVDRWSHQMTEVSATTTSGGDAVDMTIKPTFNADVNVTAPEDATTIEQLQADIQELLESASAQSATRR